MNGEREQERERVRNRLLGRGLTLKPLDTGASNGGWPDAGLDLELARDTAGRRDLTFVSGMDCLVQDLTVALTTALGSDLFNTAFGFDGVRAMAEESNPLLVRERVRVSVIDVLRRETRVRRIVDVKFDDERLDRPVSAGSSRSLRVRVVFETVTGDSLSVEVGSLAGIDRLPVGGANGG